MRFFQWPWNLFHGTQPVRKRRSSTLRLAVETLEDRLALSAASALDLAHEAWRGETFSIEKMSVASQAGAQAMIDTAALIGLDQAAAQYPYRGNGYSVAVIDTGIDYTHADLGGGWGNRVIAGWDFANNDADPMDDNGHGTHVAGIIGGSNPGHLGVASGVNFIALKALDQNGSGSFGAIEDALQWIIDHRAQYNIVAINLSLGSGNYQASPYDFLEDEFTSLKNSGVFLATAAGNSFYTYNSQQGLGYPAISPLTVAVGAVWAGDFGTVAWLNGARDNTTAADRITSFSQRSTDLDIFAPGALITSTYLGGGYQSLAGTSMASPMIAGAAVLLHQALAASGLHAQANQDGILSLMKSTGVSIVDGDDENDNVVNTGLTFKRLDLWAALNGIDPSNTAPAFDAIGDQQTASGRTLAVDLSAHDADGDPLTFSARLQGQASPYYELDQRLGLDYAGSYFTNSWGLQEKWLLARGGEWYFVLPTGELRQWAGTRDASLQPAALIATLEVAVYADPSLLWQAPAPTAPAVALSVAGNQLLITPPAGFLGQFTVDVTVSDGKASTSRSFVVTVAAANYAPDFAPVADQTMVAGRTLDITLDASDADADSLTFQVRIDGPGLSGTDWPSVLLTGGSLNLKLSYSGREYDNFYGAAEKWLVSSVDGRWYCILPNGDLRVWSTSWSDTLNNGANLVRHFDPSYYQDPTKLAQDSPTSGAPVQWSITGKVLTLVPPTGYLGSFTVTVAVSDGQASVSRAFQVTVEAERGVELPVIPDQVMPAGQNTLQVDLQIAAGLDIQVEVSGGSGGDQQAYDLDQRLKLDYAGTQFDSFFGADEKWLVSAVDGQWYAMLPSGELRQWQNNWSQTLTAADALVATLDAGHYQELRRLYDAQPPAKAQIHWSVVNGIVTLVVDAGFSGTFEVTVTASNGTSRASRSFNVHKQ